MYLLRARFLATLLCSTAMLLNACGGWVVQTTPVATLVADQQPNAIQVKQADGARRRIDRPQVVGDSIRGIGRSAVAIADVTSVSTWKTDPARTAVAVVGGGLLAAAMVAALTFSMSPMTFRVAPR